jgi:hypothetical protein
MKAAKAKIIYGGVLVALCFAFAPDARATDITFDEDTTVTLGSHDYVILAGSQATTMDVGATTVTVTVPSASTFTFQSPDRHLLNNNAGIARTCTLIDNRLAIIGSQTNVLITPDSTTLCTIATTDTDTSSSGSSGDSVGNQFNNLVAMGKYELAQDLIDHWPHLFSEEDKQLVQQKLAETASLPETPELTPEQLQDVETLKARIRELQLIVIDLAQQLIEALQERLQPPSSI